MHTSCTDEDRGPKCHYVVLFYISLFIILHEDIGLGDPCPLILYDEGIVPTVCARRDHHASVVSSCLQLLAPAGRVHAHYHFQHVKPAFTP